jgi:AAA+ superfamily predicted ATPase
VLERPDIREEAAMIIRKILNQTMTRWIVLRGQNCADWRALLELGLMVQEILPIRVELADLAGTDPAGVEECALRLGRMTHLTGRPLILDLGSAEDFGREERSFRLFLGTLRAIQCTGAVICPEAASIARVLAPDTFDCQDDAILGAARRAAARTAARHAELILGEPQIDAITRQYPLQIDGFERAMLSARSRPVCEEAQNDCRIDRFVAACKEVANERLSHFAELIEPVFELNQVVLPPDRKKQLTEIVENVRLAPKVLDEWNFRKQLPYGRGVTALFYGPSGTGKTMAAVAVARSLGVQLLRLDISRVVSKYIGETEKNIDCIFSDAQKSGSAILIDEADALLGKRSEVKDAHDRYANIEVAFLLQRMEAYDGLAILTTNLRQNLDAAFLRRLRFVVDFPRPDVAAREDIWRRCLPGGTHRLDATAFRMLARDIELTGGYIRQITLRAAFVAAAADEPIAVEHIVYATNAELAKLGRPEWTPHLPSDQRRAA